MRTARAIGFLVLALVGRRARLVRRGHDPGRPARAGRGGRVGRVVRTARGDPGEVPGASHERRGSRPRGIRPEPRHRPSPARRAAAGGRTEPAEENRIGCRPRAARKMGGPRGREGRGPAGRSARRGRGVFRLARGDSRRDREEPSRRPRARTGPWISRSSTRRPCRTSSDTCSSRGSSSDEPRRGRRRRTSARTSLFAPRSRSRARCAAGPRSRARASRSPRRASSSGPCGGFRSMPPPGANA